MRRIGIGSLVAIMIALGVVATEPLVDRVVTVGEALAAEDPETIRKKFETFASGWMEKLRERQRFNQGKAKWSPAGGGVHRCERGRRCGRRASRGPDQRGGYRRGDRSRLVSSAYAHRRRL